MSVLLICCLLVYIIPSIAFASDMVASGTCGNNLIWSLDDMDTLSILGTGAMKDYSLMSSVPWSSFKSIKKVVIGDEVTYIGYYAFA